MSLLFGLLIFDMVLSFLSFAMMLTIFSGFALERIPLKARSLGGKMAQPPKLGMKWPTFSPTSQFLKQAELGSTRKHD